MNDAIARYVEAVKFQQPPYTVTTEFLDFIREVVPPEKAALLTDMFEEITLFENRVEEATYRQRDDGKWVVTLEVKARKVRADGQGVETEIPIDDWIDVGVFGEDPDGPEPPPVLYLEKHRIAQNDVEIEVVVDEEPVRAGIDPFHKLVDRNTDDNLERVKRSGDGSAAAGEDIASR